MATIMRLPPMLKTAPYRDTVLIVEPDQPSGQMIQAVLRRAGFRTLLAEDAESAEAMLAQTHVDAIVRDVNLAPTERARSLQRLAATPPALLRRTVVATTDAHPLPELAGGREVFAVIRKPFDIERLVRVVADCVRAARAEKRRPAADRHAVERFVACAADLRRVLAAPTPSDRELLLRSQMRRAISELSAAFSAAAEAEKGAGAAALHVASGVAAELAARPAARPRRGH